MSKTSASVERSAWDSSAHIFSWEPAMLCGNWIQQMYDFSLQTTDKNEKKKKKKSAVTINVSYNEETGQPMSWHWQDDLRKAAQPTGKLKNPKVRRTCCAAHRCSNRQLLGRAVCVSAQRRPFLAWTLQAGGSHCVEGGSWTQGGNYFHEKSPSQEANTLLGHELLSQVAGYSAG